MPEIANPFLPTRFEKHDRPLIWVSERVEQLEAAECVYVCGTRGSGKTSLLKALIWSERLDNASLRAQLGEVFPKYVGVYFRIPDFLSRSIAAVDWKSVFPNAPDRDEISFNFFSAFIEAVCLEKVCEAVRTLRERGVFRYRPHAEEALVRQVVAEHEWSSAEGISNHPFTPTLGWLERSARSLHLALTRAATRGKVADTFDALKIPKAGSILSPIARQLSSLVSAADLQSEVSFKICIDDCEALVLRQQIFLNTLVRQATHPVFWILSFVDRNYETTSTLIRNQDLTDADRKVVVIDSLPRSEFRKLCERVSSLRFAHAEGAAPEAQLPEFDLKNILGRTRVNELLLTGANQRTSRSFWALVERAQQSPLAAMFTPRRRDPKGDPPKPEVPLYQQYLVEKLFPQQRIPELAHEQGPAFGAMLRRKQIAAYLSIRSEYGLQRTGFAGLEAVVEMSDGCIRDYLEIMADIFELASSDGADRFKRFRLRSTPVTVDKQRDAIDEASKKKVSGYAANVEPHAVRASRLIDSLGVLTSILQSDHNDPAVLRTPERGVFVFAMDQIFPRPGVSADTARNLVESTLLRLEIDGLLVAPKTRKQEAHMGAAVNVNLRRYRLHARYAAHFGFSYRGAYEEVRLPMAPVVQLCMTPEAVSADEWAREVARQVSNQMEGQERLPL